MSLSAKQKCVITPTITTILDLNDDVLRETFRHLSASDLCVVADVCSTFKRNAQAEFALRYKKLKFTIGIGYNSALRIFGSSIVSLCIDIDLRSESKFRNQSPQVVKLLIRYCKESLTELELNRIIITVDMGQQLGPLLSRLQVLKLNYCFWPSEMLSFCTQLHTLSLAGGQSKIGAAVKCPELNSFFVRGECYSDHSLEHLLALNPQLKEISIMHVTSGIIPLIAKYTPQIEKIKTPSCGRSIDFLENAKHLKQLTALKSLEIDCGGDSFGGILKELTAAQSTLECLKLHSLYLDQELINEITKLKHLKKLGLSSFNEIRDYSYNILMIVRNLSVLTELELSSRKYISSNDFVEIVRCAPKLRKLICEYVDEDMLIKVRDVVAKRKEKCPLDLVLRGICNRTFKLE